MSKGTALVCFMLHPLLPFTGTAVHVTTNLLQLLLLRMLTATVLLLTWLCRVTACLSCATSQ